ncbi:MAG: hypothetical protein IKE76_09390 [Clostridia bacterium]|nr:hypothetical protein [Clostridia bacterium]
MKKKIIQALAGVLVFAGLLAVTAEGETMGVQLAAWSGGVVAMIAGYKLLKPYLGEGVTK